jgi:hypothetical protein
MAPATGDPPTQDFDVLVMRFFGIGSFAFDFNVYGTKIGKYATLRLDPAELRIQKTNRRGEPTEGSAAFPTSSTWKLRELRSARVFKNPWFISLHTIDAGQYPFGLLLDMGASGWNLLLFSLELDYLIQAFTSHHVHVDRHPRTLTPLIFRRVQSPKS